MTAQPASIPLDRPARPPDAAVATDLQQSVARAIAVLRRRRWLFVFPLITGRLASLLVSLALPRRYQLSSIFERRDDVVITKLVSENSPYSFSTLRQALTINLIGYNAVSEAVEQLGLTRDFPRDEAGELTAEGRARKQALVLRLTRQLEVGLLEKSHFLDLIEVRYKGDDPDLGVRLVTRLKDNYITNTRGWISDILERARGFFHQEVSRRSAKAALMEAELLDMSLKHPGVDPADPDVLHQRLIRETTALEDLSRRREEIQSHIAVREEYLRELEPGAERLPATRPAALLPALVRNPRHQRIQQEIQAVRTQIADAKTLRKMTDLHPHVVSLNEKLRSLEAQLQVQPENLGPAGPLPEAARSDPLDGERRRLNMELKSLRETLAQIDREIPRHEEERAHLEEEKGRLFERRQTFVMKQQELQALKGDLGAWNRHLETISRVLTAEAEDRGIRFATVEEARRPRKPASPSLGGVLLLSGGAGLALAVALVFLREIFDRSFRSAARVRLALGIPVLEAVGEIRAGTSPIRLFGRRLLPALACLEALAALGAAALVYLSLERPADYGNLLNRLKETMYG
jgi:uncharacterized protein involved in exopolysaccharide biosynthesis